MTHTAHIEPLASVLRVFGPGAKYGDPYEFVCTLRWLDRETVELVGVMEFPGIHLREPILKALRDAGAKRCSFTHKGRGRTLNTTPRHVR